MESVHTQQKHYATKNRAHKHTDTRIWMPIAYERWKLVCICVQPQSAVLNFLRTYRLIKKRLRSDSLWMANDWMFTAQKPIDDRDLCCYFSSYPCVKTHVARFETMRSNIGIHLVWLSPFFRVAWDCGHQWCGKPFLTASVPIKAEIEPDSAETIQKKICHIQWFLLPIIATYPRSIGGADLFDRERERKMAATMYENFVVIFFDCDESK